MAAGGANHKCGAAKNWQSHICGSCAGVAVGVVGRSPGAFQAGFSGFRTSNAGPAPASSVSAFPQGKLRSLSDPDRGQPAG